MNSIAPIRIDNAGVTIHGTAGAVWMTQHQIASLFGVFVSAVGSNIRSILKNGILDEDEVSRRKTTANGNMMILYNLEMITALAFRLNSRKAEQYRRWLVGQAADPIVIWKIPGMGTLLN